ncbi:alpha/beta fold hydrolase [Actinotalea ferrariae]|uniref:alpha/beta fold hydrolase n=1 Tax=Actinotalea ferrariae TaxID=1386098 RepID=UPI00138DF695|nr:alpha/beta hydrolase [Actinotalea ferrariae]
MTSPGIPETRFARSGVVDIAYQVVGEGERDIVVGIGWVSHLELLWELPETVHFLRRLQSFGRLVLYDARGTGLSDRPARPATLEDLVEDLVAVLDAVGSTRAVIVGWVDKAAAAVALAARHPERVEALVLGEAMATTVDREGDPGGLDRAVVERLAAAAEQGAWGTGVLLPGIAPSVADDPRIAAWWRRWERMSATPNMAATCCGHWSTSTCGPCCPRSPPAPSCCIAWTTHWWVGPRCVGWPKACPTGASSSCREPTCPPSSATRTRFSTRSRSSSRAPAPAPTRTTRC